MFGENYPVVKFPSFSQFGEISYLEALHVLLH